MGKKAGRFQQHIHALIDISDKDHRSGRGFFLLATGERAGRHIVLHDLDAVFVLEVDTGNLVKRQQSHKPTKPTVFLPML